MFEHVRNPKWTDSSKTQIALDVKFIGENEYCGFVASPIDCTTHGPMLYHFALQRLFGEVALSDEERIINGDLPVPDGYKIINGQIIHLAAYEKAAMDELNNRLAPLNTEEAKARAEIDEEYAAERKAKITALLAVKKQPGWPITVEWPE